MNKLTAVVALLVPAISLAGAWMDPDAQGSAPKTKKSHVQKGRLKPGVDPTAINVGHQPSAATTSGAIFSVGYFGPGLCANEGYECRRIAHGESWENLFPDETQRDLVQRLNRSYNALWVGKTIVVPKDLSKVTLLSISPFPQRIDEQEKQVIVDQDKLAWGAYDANGQLINWGPIASGRDKCPDSANACRTLTGIYRVFSKENEKCKSDIFPIGKGGAKMPYCMYFHKGFAMHGSDDMPGYRASHGCVRMFIRDAKWLNEQFVETSTDKNNKYGDENRRPPSPCE